jgi:hypothetical protein
VSIQDVDRERNRESERRQDPDPLAGVLVGLRHHRVGQHGEDRSGREREHERDHVGRRVLEQGVATSDASPETIPIPIHIHRTRAFFQPLVTRPLVEKIDSGMLEMNTAIRYAAPTAPPWKMVRPITIDSGIPSRTDPSTIASAEPSS